MKEHILPAFVIAIFFFSFFATPVLATHKLGEELMTNGDFSQTRPANASLPLNWFYCNGANFPCSVDEGLFVPISLVQDGKLNETDDSVDVWTSTAVILEQDKTYQYTAVYDSFGLQNLTNGIVGDMEIISEAGEDVFILFNTSHVIIDATSHPNIAFTVSDDNTQELPIVNTVGDRSTFTLTFDVSNANANQSIFLTGTGLNPSNRYELDSISIREVLPDVLLSSTTSGLLVVIIGIMVGLAGLVIAGIGLMSGRIKVEVAFIIALLSIIFAGIVVGINTTVIS